MTAIRERSRNLGPNLEELYLCVDPSDSEDHIPITFLQTPCPRLHTIILEHAPLACIRHTLTPSSSPSIIPPFSLPSLRKLHLVRGLEYPSSSRQMSFREILDTISCTPSLVELHIQYAIFLLDGSEPIFYPNAPLTRIPLLQSLSLKFVDATNTSLLLDSLDLPMLNKLSIQMEENNEETTHWLLRLAAPSQAGLPRFPNLRHLDLRAFNVDGPALFPFIRAMYALPQLTALMLSSPPCGSLGSKLFELLSAPSPSPSPDAPSNTGLWILPNLRALCIQHCRDITGHELLRLVQARSAAAAVAEEGQGVKAIKFLRISGCYVDNEVVEMIRAVVDIVATT